MTSWKPEILEFEMWPIDKLRPNTWNPNEMEPKIYELTKLSMIEEGFSDPIDIDPTGLILDGEHRWLVAKDLGLTEVPVFVKERYNDDAKITTIRKDRTHGEPDLVKLAEIVGDLVGEFGEEEVERRLGYDESEQRAFGEVSNWDWAAYGTEEEDEHVANLPDLVTWECGIDEDTKRKIDELLPKYAGRAEVGDYGDTEEGRFIELMKDVQALIKGEISDEQE